jgi:hypothetical protein
VGFLKMKRKEQTIYFKGMENENKYLFQKYPAIVGGLYEF